MGFSNENFSSEIDCLVDNGELIRNCLVDNGELINYNHTVP